MENEPKFHLLGEHGKIYEGRPDNSELILYLGALGMYSHAMIDLSTEPPMMTRIFNHHKSFEAVRDYMLGNGYPCSINQREVASNVVNSFEKDISYRMSDLDTVPDEWLEGDSDE